MPDNENDDDREQCSECAWNDGKHNPWCSCYEPPADYQSDGEVNS